MARVRRDKPERPSLRKRPAVGSEAKSTEAPTLFSRRIIDSEPQEMSVVRSFAEALSAHDLVGSGSSVPGSITQVVIPRSAPELLEEIASTWDLHPVLVDDIYHANQRAKVERYDDVLFVVLKSAVYIDAKEEVDFNEFHLLMKDDVLVIICQGDRFIDGTPIPPDTDGIQEYFTNEKRSWTKDRELLALGPEALIYRLLDTAVDGYFPVLDGLQDDKDGIERQVFSGDTAAAERIYLLSQEVIDVLHNSTHLNRLTQALGNGAAKYAIPDDLRAYLDDVIDHLTRVLAEVGELREALSQILNVNSTLVAQRQNEDMKKISGWAAILFAPTLIGAIYGMNFDDMPELHWAFGYPMALGLMLGLGVVLYVVFRVKKWM
ncbi:magnesium and cobalt transport protein CorA [Brevibacterium linens]|uniref:Magnesium transporter n=1 Tax=Brevibacterium linens ATCC 9172 TaxID=1255617 RepID=A0A2H1KSE5_BRELN|nr:magnesium and cobalt transport protein CorA [Brevibacterium linens]KAB1942009.1 magnesium and cobalt transport protein CorA [Brevibacterium linens ATCC 9172]SMY02637.1 magnesium transporter [Brevibacterium linens ATCC 9172]